MVCKRQIETTERARIYHTDLRLVDSNTGSTLMSVSIYFWATTDARESMGILLGEWIRNQYPTKCFKQPWDMNSRVVQGLRCDWCETLWSGCHSSIKDSGDAVLTPQLISVVGLNCATWYRLWSSSARVYMLSLKHSYPGCEPSLRIRTNPWCTSDAKLHFVPQALN